MITPSGRFVCDTRLCLSMSDYHLSLGILRGRHPSLFLCYLFREENWLRKFWSTILLTLSFCQLFPDLCSVLRTYQPHRSAFN
ncbi:hypothetical protein EB796_002348 [Bugula neritina]|uniref:Uncharacterized protein n=1 Tax=Bugula neritina TaxID=10212 RepID=A0A7J7KMH7_BUGNE|nr:hypothetical protein EB796_002348 [Bugula neritina]